MVFSKEEILICYEKRVQIKLFIFVFLNFESGQKLGTFVARSYLLK